MPENTPKCLINMQKSMGQVLRERNFIYLCSPFWAKIKTKNTRKEELIN